jgi:hypothetical protein
MPAMRTHWTAFLWATLVLVGCPGEGDPCVEDATFFAESVWRVMATDCGGCHTTEGRARDSRLLLVYPPEEPSAPNPADTSDPNLALFADFAVSGGERGSPLLHKPLGEQDHGGGTRFAADAPQYLALQEMVGRVQQRPQCYDLTPFPAPVPSGITRRLSRVEFSNALLTLTGVEPANLERLPPDGLGYRYDRVVESQTVSRAHLDAFFDIATEVAQTLLAEQRLDDVEAGCSDAVTPPSQASRAVVIAGASLSLSPAWAVVVPEDPTTGRTVYGEDPVAGLSVDFDVPGDYVIALEIDVTNGPVDFTDALLGGVPVHSFGPSDGPTTLAYEVSVEVSGPQVLTWQLNTEPDFYNLAVTYLHVTIEGPLDPGAASQATERRACAEALVDGLAERAFRRPLSSTEREQLLGLYEEGAASDGASSFRMLLQGILANPNFLYLIESGTQQAPGVFALDDHEVAARLSFALCEQPPDDVLRSAAAAGELRTADEREAQARRLLLLPCARETVRRFLVHWLHMEGLPYINKSPEAFPAWSDDVRAGLVVERDRYLDLLFWDEEADLSLLFTADHAWPDPRSAFLSEVDPSSSTAVTLPAERRGVLGQPALLASTAPFSETSPVERGMFALEQLLCRTLPPPPDDLMVAPPPPDPELSTRERWAEHSNNPDCVKCHEQIDPVGFLFEGFDGIGRYRTEEGGVPVDTTGGVPAMGQAPDELSGLVELGAALAESDLLASCAAKQWMRFALGRNSQPGDAGAAAAVAETLRQDSIREGLLALVRTETFGLRYQAPEDSE